MIFPAAIDASLQKKKASSRPSFLSPRTQTQRMGVTLLPCLSYHNASSVTYRTSCRRPAYHANSCLTAFNWPWRVLGGGSLRPLLRGAPVREPPLGFFGGA